MALKNQAMSILEAENTDDIPEINAEGVTVTDEILLRELMNLRSAVQNLLEHNENIHAGLTAEGVPPVAMGKDPNSDKIYGVWMDSANENAIKYWADAPSVDATYTTQNLFVGEEPVKIAPRDRENPTMATYNGTAKGFATHKDNGGDITANVKLAATFGIGETNPSVMGDINNFEFVGGSKIPGWEAKVTGTWGTGTNDEGETVDTTDFAVGEGATGEWKMTFYTTATDENNFHVKRGYPTNAVGHFDLTFTNGRAVGAFDADRDRPEENTGN